MNPLARTKAVIDTAVSGHEKEVLDALPIPRSMNRFVLSNKQKELFCIPRASRIDKIDLAALLGVKTSLGEQMLYFDNQRLDMKRFTIMATKKNLKRLKKCKVIAYDSTYEV